MWLATSPTSQQRREYIGEEGKKRRSDEPVQTGDESTHVPLV